MQRMGAQKRVSLLVVLALLTLAAPAQATGGVIPVTTTLDEYDGLPNATCSLREAITSINSGAAFGGCPAGAAGDTVLLAAGQTYTLTRTGPTEDGNSSGDLDFGVAMSLATDGGPATVDAAAINDRVLDVITGTLTAQQLVITNGRANDAFGGGGLRVNTGQAAILTHTQIISNSAGNGVGGGISNLGVLTLTYTSLVSNTAGVFEGGGLHSRGTGLVQESVIVSNTAVTGGGGIWLESGALSLSNVTLSGNSVAGDGGAIYNAGGGISLNNVTLTNNSAATNGGGVAGASVSLSNSILAGNIDQSTGNAPDCAAVLYSTGYNVVQVVQTTSPACTLTGSTASVTTGQPAQLGPLSQGNATLIHLPLPGSPAINAGNPNTPDGQSPNCNPRDQRGYLRVGSRCDIGAVESDGLSQSLYLPLILR
jgi:CSLREA domain-containing protein